MKKIYLDHSATTPVDKKVYRAMEPYFCENFGNPASIHCFGQEAICGVDKAREQVANFLNCNSEEIIFTSGATESNNLAIKGLIKALKKRKIKSPHIITSAIEHSSVIEVCKDLDMEVEFTFLPVNSQGFVSEKEVKKAIKDNTVLVSIMYVNNETGAKQPIREIGKIIKKHNEKNIREWQKRRVKDRGNKPMPVYFHTDATQAVNFFNCDSKHLHVDLLSLSAHKIYGPKGVGALFVKNGVPLEAVQSGGHQEGNLRSGTLNVAGIVGLGKAISLLSEKEVTKNNKKILELKKTLVAGLEKKIKNIVINTDLENSSPSHLNVSFVGAEGESVLISLDLEGVAISTGSACASVSSGASHVLRAMNIETDLIHSSVRFTLGKNNTLAEIKRVIKILPPIIGRLRKMNPNYGYEA